VDNKTYLRELVDLRDRTLQKARIAFGNRVGAGERETDAVDPETIKRLADWEMKFEKLEEEAEGEICELVKEWPIVQQMYQVRGIGLTLAAKVVAMVDIEKADTVSALWRYAGYAVIDGQREYPKKGEKLAYNKRLKCTLYLVGTSFLRSGSPYRKIYDKAKERYSQTKIDWTPMHKHRAAQRIMIKVFLSHLWERWRKLEGLPTRELYVQEKLGHEHYYKAEEFGWPVL
jgi:hypothetical protein